MADARDDESLRAAFAGIDVVASLAGPFLELGLGPVQAAVDAGAHYLDTSGEQQWVGLVHAEIQAETVVLPAFGFDYVPGDLAARLAAEKVEGPLDELVVAYSVKGVGTSRGTRRTIGRVMGQKQVAWQDGRLVPSRLRRDDAHASASRSASGRWSSGAAPSRSRCRGTRTSGTCARTSARPAIAAKAGGLGRLAAPFVRAASRFGPSGPSEASRRKSRFTVVAEARGPGGTRPRRCRGHRRLRAHGAPDRPRRRGASRRRGAWHGRARPGRGVRRAHARRPARAVPADRGVMSSGPALTVRVNATAPNAERGRVLRPLLRVAGRGRREGRQRRPSAPPVRDAHLRRAAPFAL